MIQTYIFYYIPSNQYGMATSQLSGMNSFRFELPLFGFHLLISNLYKWFEFQILPT
ncbi:hypothetical protein P872_10835 [Rhodonellum psychrophilum GCM71 = DSM 17998]|uniref:Uncharacterized protein n=1 Tax=Rhodonellum psychrophilum GCM71 = DSM 17998 TaxID=1123057 RepID=U5BQE8_9BACT|nr:hypothetical protein P872_10835 [Rhodonellum psychrophilum GCM71 = DSM 17998]